MRATNENPMNRFDLDHIDSRDPRQAPFNFAGGKWFMVQDYKHFDNWVLATKSFIAGGVAGAVSKTSVAPAERVKIVLQTQRLTLGKDVSLPATVYRIATTEGLVSFWRGNFANVVRIIPNKGIGFMCNDLYLELLKVPGQSLSEGRRLLAGSLSGATVVTFTYPLDLVQTRLAASTKQQYKGILHCVQSIIQKEGYSALYKGYITSLLGITPYLGTSFYMYHKLKTLLQDEHGKITTVAKLACGAVAGCVAQTISFPLDTMRRRLQVQGASSSPNTYKGGFDCGRQIWQKEGIRGFYRGAVINAFRAGPSQAIQFWVYDFAKILLDVKGGSDS